MMIINKHIILFFLFVLFVIDTNAQTTIWGKVHTASRDSYIERIIGTDEEGNSYTLRRNTDFDDLEEDPEFELEKFDTDLNIIYTKRLDIPEVKGREHRFEGIEIVNGKILLFTSFHHQKDQRNIAYISKIDKDGTLENVPIEVDFITTKKIKNIGSFHFSLSHDSNKVIVFHQEPKKYELNFKKPLPQTYNKKLYFKLLDNYFNTEWERELEFPYHEDDFEINQVYLDPDENLHMLAQVNEKKDKWFKEKPDPDFSLFSFIAANNKLKEFALKFDDKKIRSLGFKPFDTGEMIFAGFFDENDPVNEEKSITGVFLLKVNPVTDRIISKGTIVFSAGIVTEFIGNKKAEKGKKITDYFLNHIFNLSNGNICILAEQYYTDVTCYIDQRTGLQTCHDNYYYNDIMAINFTQDGSVKWIKKIPKKQQSINDFGFYSSYLPVGIQNEVHFFFNDNVQNLSNEDKQKDKVMSNPKRSVMSHITLNTEGEITTATLTDEKKDQEQIFTPKIHKNVHPSEIIVLGVKKREFKLGKLTF